MKPMKVEAGQHAPDVDEMLKEAKELMAKADAKFGSEIGDSFERVNGVEKVKPGYYHTNQQKIVVENVENTGAKKEEAKLTTHSGWPNDIKMRENKVGDPSDKNPQGAYNLTDYS